MRVITLLASLAVQQLQASADVIRGFAVVSPKKFSDVLLHVGVRVPQQFCQDVGAQWPHLAIAAAGIVALLEQPFHAVFDKELHVGLERVEVRKGLLIMREVRRVVPDIKQRRDRLPGDDVVAEALVLGRRTRLQRMRKATLNRTQTHDHVVARAQRLRRLAAVLIGERINAHVRIVALDVLGNCIHESQEGRRRTALRVVQRLALRALAIIERVVL